MDVTEAAKLYFFEFFWFSCTEFTDYSHQKLVKFSCFLLRVFFCVKTENTIRTWRRNFQNFPQSVDKKISLLSTFFGLGQLSTVAMGAARRKNIPEYFILGHKNPSQLSQNWGGRNSPTQKTELVPTPPVFLAVYNRYRRNKERFICPPDLGSFGAHVRGGGRIHKKGIMLLLCRVFPFFLYSAAPSIFQLSTPLLHKLEYAANHQLPHLCAVLNKWCRLTCTGTRKGGNQEGEKQA